MKVDGRVSALLELGAGFHDDLTGRENTFLNGSIMGLSKKEIEDRFEDIMQFAEIDKFIDTPVRTYSSGMFVRLGFSIAVNVDPDILVIDEALAVGDQSFQQKSFHKIMEFKKNKKTIIFVSHNLDAVEGIDKVTMIEDIDLIKNEKKYSLHDFDLGMTLKLLKKMKKIDSVKILGVPVNYGEERAFEELKKLITTLL